MNNCSTPIADFLNEYALNDTTRLHMPGHKGALGDCHDGGLVECLKRISAYDLTEITGADNLYDPSGIIKESEENAGKIFGAKTFYLTEGSSQAVKAMIYLAKTRWQNYFGADVTPYLITLGSSHKALFYAAELLGVNIVEIDIHNLSLNEIVERIYSSFSEETNPIGVYVTYPDYFGNIVDLKGIKNALKEMDIPLLVDGAHSAYFKFLDHQKYAEFVHPVDSPADMSCTSAHKTLPTLTGAAYLHINPSFSDMIPNAIHALDIFGSSSPSYLTLASLDAFNGMVSEFEKAVWEFCEKVETLKREISFMGFNVHKSDPLRIVVWADKRFSGSDFASSLKAKKCEVECFDPDYVIMMLSPYNTDKDLERIKEAFTSLKSDSFISSNILSSDYNCLDNFK
ncbi:MAG: hypothetical protein J5515_01800 [Lachnospiraceae bacterium]|nr:hypothetical protein [Lachnospiraceae bacterium]